jgi:hypothetical protein
MNKQEYLDQQIKHYEKLGYDYRGQTKSGYLFTEDILNEPKRYHSHYFLLIDCKACGKPFLKRKYNKAQMHRECSCRITAKKRMKNAK